MLVRVSDTQYLRGSNQHVIRIRRHKMRARVYIWLLAMVALYGYFALTNLISFSQYTFRFEADAPTKLVSPLAQQSYAQEKDAGHSAEITPVLTPFEQEKAYIYTKPHADVIYRIWGLESSFGKQPFLYCTRKGLVSDMGYNVLNHECFDSFQQEVDTVNRWIDQHQDLSLGKLLCTYNEGRDKQACTYSNDFMTL